MRIPATIVPRATASAFLGLLLFSSWTLWNEGHRSTGQYLHAQDASAATPAASIPQFDGPTSCVACHEKPNPLYVRLGTTKFVRLTESDDWLKKDKHSRAVELIDPKNSPLGKQMCEKLDIPDIHQAKQCLNCHANWQYDAKKDTWGDRPAFHEFGVSCESCHGPASLWKGPHEKQDWRKLSPEKKLELGMVEVRNPVARAKQCLACHVGNAAQGKVVTHDMYAAGHPPLPGVELETFAYEMPSHWRHISEKLAENAEAHGEEKAKFDLYDEFVAANPKAVQGGALHSSRSALISAVVAMQASLELVGAQVEDAKRVPDFAAFDCYACHHDLKTPAWRQRRKDVHTPGRPHPAVWPTTLIHAAFAYARLSPESYNTALEEYQQAFDAQPFGDFQALKPARLALQIELSKLLAAVEAVETDKASLQRAFDVLRAPAADATLDFDAARQTYWALTVLAKDLEIKLPAKFAAGLHTTLPAQDKQIVNDLPTRMKALSDYDPDAFRAELEALAK